MIKVKWFGHSMWKIRNDHVSLITDPFTDIGYPLPKHLTADIVLSSHDHFDHNNFELIEGNYQIVNERGDFTISGVHISAFPTCHDECDGAKRGNNLLLKFVLEGISFLHCGDLGHDLNQEMISRLGKIDVLFIPVGGHFTIDAKQAKNIADMIDPMIIFPMHYKTDVLDFPISTEKEFLDLAGNVRKIEDNEIELKPEDFSTKKTIVLDFK